MQKKRAMYFGLAVGVFAQASASAAVRYVKPTSTGAANCTTWGNACTLKDAIPAAIARGL